MISSFLLRRIIILISVILSLSYHVFAQLGPGSIIFVGYDADGVDGFAIVALEDVPANSSIHFTDNEWNGMPIGNGGAFLNTSESEVSWDSGSLAIAAGTVISFTTTSPVSASAGTLSGSVSLALSNEVIYAFIGPNNTTPGIFLSAIGNDGFGLNGSLTGTGLTEGINAIGISGDEDIMVYNGSLSCKPIFSSCVIQIADASNWISQDGAGTDQSIDGIYPDWPGDVPSAFSEGTLPVQFLSLDAKLIENGSIQIQWQTATEINNDYFSIERARDDLQWELLSEIGGAGNSNSPRTYSFVDIHPFPENNYYRLKQTDYDGSYSYSDLIAVNQVMDPDIPFLVYPNPSSGISNIISNVDLSENIEIYDLAGRNMSRMIQFEKTDSKHIRMNIQNLNPGIYFLKAGGTLIKIQKIEGF